MLLFIAAVDSRADELTDLKKSVEEQQRELEELQKKVEDLEERRRLEEEAAREMEDIRPKFGVNLGVFGDINFSSDSREKENETFSLGELTLYSDGGRNGEALGRLYNKRPLYRACRKVPHGPGLLEQDFPSRKTPLSYRGQAIFSCI
jgi:hypothetical protein